MRWQANNQSNIILEQDIQGQGYHSHRYMAINCSDNSETFYFKVESSIHSFNMYGCDKEELSSRI